MKKILIISSVLTASVVAFAQANNIQSDGLWQDDTTWVHGTPDITATDYNHINITSGRTVIVDADTDTTGNYCYNGSMYAKPNATLILAEGGTLNYAGAIAIEGTDFIFLGGSIVSTNHINQSENKDARYVFGGVDENGDFHAAISKSINTTKRVQFSKGNTTTYNLAASNLLSQKSTGRDENAIVYADELNNLQGVLDLNFSNILLEDLQDKDMESGTYYVALISYRAIYDDITNTERFNAVLSEGSAASTGLVSFEGFEWASDSLRGANTLYAVLNVSVPEPSTYAMIFGVLALAFVAYRRRK